MTAAGQVQSPVNEPRTPPYKLAGLVLLSGRRASSSTLVWFQFRGGFADPEKLTLIVGRSGLSMDPGSKVTFNGVEIGRVVGIDAVDSDGEPKAKVTLDVNRKFVDLIPANVDAEIKASTVFGNKYVAFSSPKNPDAARIYPAESIDVSSVTTEFNTLFETVVSVAQAGRPDQAEPDADRHRAGARRAGRPLRRVDRPTATRSSPTSTRRCPGSARTTSGWPTSPTSTPTPSPDLFDGLKNAVTTARTLNDQQANIDQALMAVGRVRQHRRRRLRARRALPGARRRRPDPHHPAARRVQPRAVLHHPQLPRRRAEDRRVAGRQRLLAAHSLGGARRGPTRTSTPTTCRA